MPITIAISIRTPRAEASAATAAIVMLTCNAPESSARRHTSRRASIGSSSPISKSNKATPNSASARTRSESSTQPMPPGPMMAPATSRPATPGSRKRSKAAAPITAAKITIRISSTKRR